MCDFTNMKTKSAQTLSTDTKQSCSCEHGIERSRVEHLNHNDAHPLYSPTAYFPQLYPPPFSAMSYIYNDFLQYLSLGSELNSRLPKCNQMYDCNNLHGVQTKKHGRNRNAERKCKINKCSCSHFQDDVCNGHCPHLCHCQTKCSCCPCCVQRCRSSLENNTATCRCCQHFSESCPSFNANKRLTISHCHCQNPKPTCQCETQCMFNLPNHMRDDIPEREQTKKENLSTFTNISKENETRKSSDTALRAGSLEKSSKNVNILPETAIHTEPLKHYLQNNENRGLEYGNSDINGYNGGTGDENMSEKPAEMKDKYLKKPSIKSTAYFLPISSLNKNK